jgi:RNA polymerase sigma factor (sigma-70 family)
VDIDENESDEVKDYMVDSIEDMSHIAVDRLSNLLEKIKTDEKMILLMKYRDDMSIKDIQSVLKISESAVKMRIKRAKEKIQSLYHIQYKESV